MNTFENFFEERLSKAGSVFRPERVFLGLLVGLGVGIIILFNAKVLPLNLPYGLFYLFLLVLLGLYRPTYLWQAVVFFLPFEIVVLARFGGGDIRTYQLGMLALLVASTILWLQRKITLPVPRWFDAALGLVLVGAILTFLARNLPLESIKAVLVLCSFALLYFLGRLFVRSKQDLKTFFTTLRVSGGVIASYALYQSLAFKYYLMHFMVMPGRPNSVFEEADWLGFFIGLVAIVSFIAFIRSQKWRSAVSHLLVTFFFLITLILTVSRSAWLGFAGALSLLVFILGIQYFSGFFGSLRKETQKEYDTLLKAALGAPLLFLVAFWAVSFLELTRFDLDQRFNSVGTGEQVITIACKNDQAAPANIQDVAELPAYGCQHINLEDQSWYQQNGFQISTTKRPDPNIEIRQNLYSRSFSLLKEHFLLGIGWGESLKVFGTDDRGAGLNSSNISIEIWLGSGLIGILGFLVFWLGFLAAAILRLCRKREMTEGFWITLLLVTLWVHATIFNLFNAGFLLGTFIALLIVWAWYLEKTCPHLQTLWRK